MSKQFTGDVWGASTPFRMSNTPRLSSEVPAPSKDCGVVKRISEGRAVAGLKDKKDAVDPSVCVADSLEAAENSGKGALVADAAGANYAMALINPEPATTMAVTTTFPSAQLRQCTFSGLFDDVNFPVHTFFSPPRPPGELLPRVRRPNRNAAPVYVNDISRAGAREHNAQREVSRVWRGVLCRRRLRQARVMEMCLNDKVLRIQCWWRSLQAKWRRRKLMLLRSEWSKERTAQFVAVRVLNTTNILYWQHGKYEEAALRIQRTVRWYLREVERQRCAMKGLPESKWPPAFLRPVPLRQHPYFPWRNRQPASLNAEAGALVDLMPGEASCDVATVAALPTRRTLLQFPEAPPGIEPPTQEEVEQINAKMRVKQAERAAALQTPEALSRKEWKTEGVRKEDLDFNAGIVQRLYRTKRVAATVHTKELTAAYFNKAASVIARVFRMYVLIKHMRRRRERTAHAVKAKISRLSTAKIEALKSEAVWQKDLMDAAAFSIQRCWAWYRYRFNGIVPASYRAANTVPTPPCYGLLKAHIEREHALRRSTMNLLEHHQYAERQQLKFYRFVPKKEEVYEHTGFLFVLGPSDAFTDVDSTMEAVDAIQA
ncbi:hypothetical protein ABL78_0826 [Leptomonas seymouri]|uniref:Uncharacterized protein n=1 Tax=Leptomonas seymouri TaxID=5684 RepID=A0A0N1I9S0_LEPSE|nr:hypothetical protein ABL78_0826 [Leptomonas seymouri]|eukprot:KPI90073.1 hypothetical protein ABL78_0826 [Leptomonas seymouri]